MSSIATKLLVVAMLIGALLPASSAQSLPAPTAQRQCDGKLVTISGSDANDKLQGTSGDDVIWAGDGNDVIRGLGGDDTICAGKGNDRIFGGGGNDTLYGAAGKDKISGGTGNDFLYGEDDVDSLKGGNGNDILVGGDQSDRLRGGKGDDTIRGDRGNDRMWGGSGDDHLEGGPQSDRVSGGSGQDVCVVLVASVAKDADRPGPSCERLTARSPHAEQLDCVSWPTEEWPTGDVPSGVSEKKLRRAINRALAGGAKSIVVVHGGRMVAEGYDPGVTASDVHSSFSVSKSFTSTVIGLLAQEGRLDLDVSAPVSEWSKRSDPRRAINLRHLLDMASGLEWYESYTDPSAHFFKMLNSPDTAAYAAALPLESEPGTQWQYSTGTTQILSRIVSQTLDLYSADLALELDRRLFSQLGQSATLDYDDSGVWFGGIVTKMTTREFAKLGLLYLRNGVWEDRQLLDHHYVEYVRSGGDLGHYAGQFWHEGEGKRFRAVGLNGQGIHVLPDLDLVIAINSDTGSGGGSASEIKALFESAEPAVC